MVTSKSLASALPPEVLVFAKRHSIPFSQLYDARGRAIGAIKERMEEIGAIIAFNARGCQAAGHTIRTRSNHCPVCKPANIAFLRRHVEPGFVYIAVSKTGKLVKIGTSIDLDSRLKALNRLQYGGQSDWEFMHSRKFLNAGKAESEIQAQLSEFNVPGKYVKDGFPQDCYELFRCSEQQALEILNQQVLASKK